MATRQASTVAEPNDWQAVDDWQTVQPAAPQPKPAALPPLHVTPDISQDMFKAGVHSQMLGVTPGVAYEQRETIDKTLREHGGNYDDGELDPTIANDIKVGFEGSIFGLHHRGKLAETVRNPGMIDRFVTGLSEMFADLPWYVAGGAGGGVVAGAAGSEVPVVGNITLGTIGAGAGAFALPSAMREVLVQGIQHGEVKSFSDVLRRAAAVTWEGAKGAVVGATAELTGGIPVGKLIAKSGLATTAVKGLYQATALTTAADLLEGHLPTAQDFAGNAALILPLNLLTHGRAMLHPEAKQALMDVYAKDGKTPAESTETLHAQPPVKPDAPEGLRPAIQFAEGHVEGESGEDHHGVSERVLGKRPVSLESLEKDPSRADRVLETPAIHEQEVIDRAWEIKNDEIEAGIFVGKSSLEEHTFEVGRNGLIQASESLKREAATALNNDPISWEDVPVKQIDPSQLRTTSFAHETLDSPTIAKYAEDGGEPIQIIRTDNGDVIADGNHRAVAAMTKGGKIAAKIRDYRTAKTEAKGEEKPLRIDELYDRNAMKSGRGFVTPDGQFLSRMEARKWMKDNEPDVHDLWLKEANGDKQAELNSEAYVSARNRAQARSVAEGDPTIAGLAPDNASRLAAARQGLNKIKSGYESEGYGKEVLRTLFAGQRDTRIAVTTQLRDSLKKLIPDFHDQEALSILRDYKGTPDKLASDLEQIRAGDSERMKALIPSIERAMNPSPALLEADAKLTDYYASALNEGQQLGFMSSTIDPSHYSPHILTRILDGEKPSGGGKAVMTQNTPFAKERSYPTVLDAIKTERIDARTVNALDALSIYGDRHATVVATKLLATELKNTELGKYGTADKHPDGWVPLSDAFRTTRAITDTDGEAHSISQSLYVPKDVADAMKPLFESGLKGTPLAPLLKAQGYVKALELGLSLFHMKALTVTAFNNMGLADFTRAMASDLKSPEFASAERGWAADGLTTSKTTTPYEAYKGLDKSSIPTGFDKFANAPVISQIDAVFKKTTEATFDVIQRKFKVQDAELKSAKWLANHPDATNEQYFAARRSIAKEVNSAYGGLNWDVLGVGKTVRDVSRLVLLAPDWTFSNVLTAKYSFEGGPAGSAARMFWAKSFATGFAMTAAASIAIGGKYDPSDVKHLDQVYLGTDKDGKEMYANWFFAGAPKDALTLVKRSVSDTPIAGTAEFIVSKASPAAGVLGDIAYNKKGGSNIPVRNTQDSGLEQTGEAAAYAATRVVPITGVSAVKTVADALTDPNHEYSYTDLLNLAADAMGSPTTHTGGAKGGESTGNSTDRFQRAGRGGKSRFTIKGGR